jgi:hypothetical protein
MTQTLLGAAAAIAAACGVLGTARAETLAIATVTNSDMIRRGFHRLHQNELLCR